MTDKTWTVTLEADSETGELRIDLAPVFADLEAERDALRAEIERLRRELATTQLDWSATQTPVEARREALDWALAGELKWHCDGHWAAAIRAELDKLDGDTDG